MTTYHMRQSIACCLRNNRIGTIDFLEDGEGNLLSDADARVELNKLLEMGHTVMPVGDDCKGFDVFGSGCPGHEPLAGGDLCRAMLERGDKYVMCRSGSDFIVISGVYDDGYLVSQTGEFESAVPINNMGEPLTAKEVGL